MRETRFLLLLLILTSLTSLTSYKLEAMEDLDPRFTLDFIMNEEDVAPIKVGNKRKRTNSDTSVDASVDASVGQKKRKVETSHLYLAESELSFPDHDSFSSEISYYKANPDERPFVRSITIGSSENKLSDETISLIKCLPVFKNLTTLNILNKFKNKKVAIKSILSINKIRKLENLTIRGLRLSKELINKLSVKRLKTLTLKSCKFGTGHLSEFMHNNLALSLERLELHDCSIVASGLFNKHRKNPMVFLHTIVIHSGSFIEENLFINKLRKALGRGDFPALRNVTIKNITLDDLMNKRLHDLLAGYSTPNGSPESE